MSVAEINQAMRTVFAVGEIAQVAAHLYGVVGPVEFTVCRPRDYDWCGLEDDYLQVTEEEIENEQEFIPASI